MRRTREKYRHPLQRGMPIPRLMTMCLMLGVLWLFYTRLRDPDTWRVFLADANREDVAVAHAASAKRDGVQVDAAKPQLDKPPELTATGPTDETADEMTIMDDDRQGIADGSLHMKIEEMQAYYRVLKWVENQPVATLCRRARKHVLYDEFRANPDQLRFQILQLNLTVRQVVPSGVKTPSGQEIYEVRGTTIEGGPNIFFGGVIDLPAGMPIGETINEPAKLVGYFFKIQGYFSMAQELSNKKNLKPLMAPVILGRLVWQDPTPVKAASTPMWLWVAITASIVVVGIGAAMFAHRFSHRPLPPLRVGSSHDSDSPSVDRWLDQAQSGELILDSVPERVVGGDGEPIPNRLSGNISCENGESNNGHHEG